jgi:NAD-dependent deacetylase
MDVNRINRLLGEATKSSGAITVLTGAGISAESGIPTFRGPEGYWTVGSRIYQPQDMATLKMFQQNPRQVWQWYLYRMGVCRQATPNSGHMALIALENLFPDRFTLVTQNVDNLHLRAGHHLHNTFQIHGNVFYYRCSENCSSKIYPIPKQINPKGKNERITRTEWQLLHCQNCGGLMRPHVLWFDEAYNEHYYRLESALEAARNTSLLIVAGTSGTTNLPNQVVWQVHRQGGIIIDINIDTNPFGTLADSYSRGASIRQPSCQALPWMIERLKAIV